MIFNNNNKSSNRIKHITDRLYRTELGCTLISAVFGVALAFMFQKVCRGNSCVVHKSPPGQELDGVVYEIPGEGCYIYKYKPVECQIE